MKYIIDKKSKAPAYLQLYMCLRDDIVNGIYPLGSKLPSKRILSADTDVSSITVEHAYGLLCDEGYVESRQRSGYYVIFRTDDGFASSPTPDLPMRTYRTDTAVTFPFSVLAKTMRSVISDLGEGILERSPGGGCLALRNAIRLYLAQSKGLIADARQIIIGSGAEQLYSQLIKLLGKDKIYAIEAPSYHMIEQVYNQEAVCVQKLPLGRDGIETDALKDCQADILHISPYRSFPSGVTATASKRHEYLRWAEKENRWIIEDDFESEFSVSTKPEETLFSHTKFSNVIYMNTFSKTVSPSFRVAYMVLPPLLAEKHEKELGGYACTVPTYIQYVLAELIAKGDFQRHINRVRRAKRKELAK